MTNDEVTEAVLSVIPDAVLRFEPSLDDTLCFAEVNVGGRKYSLGFVFGGASDLSLEQIREQVKGAYERALSRVGKEPLVEFGRAYEFGACEIRYGDGAPEGTLQGSRHTEEETLSRIAKSALGDEAHVSQERGDYCVAFGARKVVVYRSWIGLGEHVLRGIITDAADRWRREAEALSKVRERPGGDFLGYHYDMIGADMAGETRHPETVIRELAPSACRLQPESIGDCWLFVSREIDPQPTFIRQSLLCAKPVECGGTCVLEEHHEGRCECIGDEEGKPGSCPA